MTGRCYIHDLALVDSNLASLYHYLRAVSELVKRANKQERVQKQQVAIMVQTSN